MSLTLLQWRRETAALYAAYRGAADPEHGWEIWRARRNALLTSHPDTPLPTGSSAPPYGVYDPGLRFEVEVDTDVAPVHLDINTGTDGVVPLDRIARLELPGLGGLDVWWLGSYGGGVFVPMRDATAGTTSYGGGRYLIDTVKGADPGGEIDPTTGRGSLVVDLNLAYHPSCAYNEMWACPLAPAGNVLDAAVHAGERLPGGGWY